MAESLLITNGVIVNEDEMFEGEVQTDGGVITAVSRGYGKLQPKPNQRVIDAKGKMIIPGGIDPHTHFEMEFMGTVSCDDFKNGTEAALAGGTTMIIDFVQAGRGVSLLKGYEKWRGKADSKVTCDYGLHVIVPHWYEETPKEMQILTEQHGVNSFKFFMAYKNSLMLSDAELIPAFKQCKSLGAIAQVHAESGEIIEEKVKDIKRLGITGPEGHLYSRMEEIEGDAVSRAVTIANQFNVPLYIVHVMSKSASNAVAAARQRGCVVFGEPIAAGLGADGGEVFHQCWFHSAAHILSPPLRNDPTTPDHLMTLLACDALQLTGTDNCTFQKSQKAMGAEDFTKIPNGVNGVEERMSIVWEKGVQSGKMSPMRFVAVTSSTAAKIFNIYPKKGRIAVGSDADLVIWDPNATKTISAKTHHYKVEINIFEGKICHGVPTVTISRGKVVWENGKLNTTAGAGKFVATPTYSPFVYSTIQQREKVCIPQKVEREPAKVEFVAPLPPVAKETKNQLPNNDALRSPMGRNQFESTFSFGGEETNVTKKSTRGGNPAGEQSNVTKKSTRGGNPPGGTATGFW